MGAYYHRMCSRMEKAKAVTAAAHKLARLIYTLLTKEHEYTDQGQEHYETRYRQRVVNHLSQRVAKLGMKMVPIEEVLSKDAYCQLLPNEVLKRHDRDMGRDGV